MTAQLRLRRRARSNTRGAIELPGGTLTLLFTDIEGSTRLLERLGERYPGVLDQHHRIIREAVAAHGGHEIRTAGDAFFVVFTRVGDAVRAVVAAQRGLASCAWPDGAVRVRMGLHMGEPRIAGDDYIGIDVHRAARICSAAHGAQVIISETTASALAREPISGVALRDLGEHWLKDLSRPLRLHQVIAEGLADRFPQLRTLPEHATAQPHVTFTSHTRPANAPVHGALPPSGPPHATRRKRPALA